MRQKLKEFTRTWLKFTGALTFLVLILVVMRIYFAGVLATDPEELVEEYTRFLGGIVSMLIGFYLVNVLWDQRNKVYQAGRFRKIMLHFHLKINALCRQIKQLLGKDFSIEQNKDSQRRDHQVHEILQKLRSLGQGIDNYAPEVDLIDDDTMREMAVSIWADIQTNLERLPVGQDFRIDLDEFEETIDLLIESTERGIALLR